MALIQPVGFGDVYQTEALLEASATTLGGFTINQNFDPEIEDILRSETVFWQLLPKRAAQAPIVQKIKKTTRPQVGFIDKMNLTGSTMTPHANTALDLTDPGEEVKAIAGRIQFNHFPRSMANQQGNPYLDEIAEETNDLIVSCARKIEMGLFRGNKTTDPLQFSGLDAFCRVDHTFTANITTATPDRIADKLNEICMRATTDRDVIRRVTHIFCSGAGSLFLQREIDDRMLYQNLMEVTPGVKVPGIVTSNGVIPIIVSPYVTDVDGGAGTDTLTFYALDMQTLEWNGVFPYGGSRKYDPQIFDISNTINGMPLVEERFVLLYGCLYPRFSAEGIWKLNVTAPSGSTWSPQSW
jgi:hypothetical protein